MPVLKNARHEVFAQAVAAGATASQAYATAGYVPHHDNPSRLRDNEGVAARVRELQVEAQRRLEFTVADMVAEFDENRRLSIKKDQMAAANAASSAKAKVLGFVVDKFKDVTDLDNMNDDELAAERARNDKEIAELREARGHDSEGREPPTTH